MLRGVPGIEGSAMADALALSIVDAARTAGVGRSTLYEAIRSGALVARKAGRRTLITRSDLAAWLTSLPTIDAKAA